MRHSQESRNQLPAGHSLELRACVMVGFDPGGPGDPGGPAGQELDSSRGHAASRCDRLLMAGGAVCRSNRQMTPATACNRLPALPQAAGGRHLPDRPRSARWPSRSSRCFSRNSWALGRRRLPQRSTIADSRPAPRARPAGRPGAAAAAGALPQESNSPNQGPYDNDTDGVAVFRRRPPSTSAAAPRRASSPEWATPALLAQRRMCALAAAK